MNSNKKQSNELEGFIDNNPEVYFKYEDMLLNATNEDEEAEAYDQLFYILCLTLIKHCEKKHGSYEIPLKEIDKNSKLYATVIAPAREALEDIGILVSKTDIFNTKEASNYINRVRTKGNYSNTPQGKRYKILAFKKMFGLTNKKYTKTDVMVLNKEILNNDFSVRQDLILEVMSEYGDNKNPIMAESHNIKISKVGLACTSEEKALYDYLLGQFVENGGSPTKVMLNEELFNGLKIANGRGDRFEPIKKALATIATQVIFIDDTAAKDKATKQIGKSVSENGRKNIKTIGSNLMNIKYIEIEGQASIEFTIPLMKMFCSHKQYDRLISGEAIKHWNKNPRVYWIARELSALSRNKRNNKLKVETLLKNINEWERYRNYSDKKTYLKRLTKDIETAIKYVKTEKQFIYNGCTVGTLKETYIKCE